MDRRMAVHSTEVESCKRFEFGANWAQFLNVLKDNRIAIAEQSYELCWGYQI